MAAVKIHSHPVYLRLRDWQDELRGLRRDLHRHPETAFQEVRTAELVAERLARWGVEVHRGLAGTGVVGTLRNGSTRRSIGLRADMDALAMTELSEFEHRSCYEGRFHGCGHDGHTVMLLAAARYLSVERPFDGTVHFIFQPAEENEGGGRVMVRDGLFEQFPCDAVFGMHNIPGMPLGRFAVRAGPMMAGFDVFDITLHGHGGHAAMPHETRDVIVAAAELISALQSIVSRRIAPTDSAVLSVTQIHAGSTYNVLPESAQLSGTVRYFSTPVREIIEQSLRAMAMHVTEAHGLRADVRYEQRYPATVNSDKETALCADVLAQTFGEQSLQRNVAPLMAAEDFAFMLEQRPGAYIWAGNGDEPDAGNLHNPRYDFNDELIPLGATYWVELVRSLLLAAAADHRSTR